MGMTLRNRKVVGSRTEKDNKKLYKKRKTHDSMPNLLRTSDSGMSLSSYEDDASEYMSVKGNHFLLDIIYGTVKRQFRAVSKDFSWNGLPWEGEQCRSIKAGMSGCLFGLTALFCPSNRVEQTWWIIQAITSVLADYVYIDRRSIWHGIDRIWAQSSLLYLVIRGPKYINLVAGILLPSLAISCFILSNRAKMKKDLEQWHWCHFLWHIVAPAMTCLAMYLSYTCPPNESEAEYFRYFCKHKNKLD